MKDQFNREITYLRISLTEVCNYNCRYCKPETDLMYHTNQLTDDEIIRIVEAAARLGVTKIRLTGGEPLLRKNIVELIRRIKNVEGIEKVVMTTNASTLHQNIHALKEAGLSRVNLSLDSIDPVKFKYITGGGNVSDVLKSIEKLIELKMLPVKINVVLLKGINDDEIKDFVELTRNQEIIVRFIELMPIGTHELSYEKHFISNKEVLRQIPELIPSKRDFHETATYFKLPDSIGKVGLISAISNHFCATCNRLRVTSDGLIKTCLHEDKEYDLLSHMRQNKGPIDEFLKECILHKPKSHKINQGDFEKVKRGMYQIGG